MWKLLWFSVKKSTPLWVTVLSLFLALWPIPSSWNAIVEVDIRLILVMILMVGIAIFTLIDFATRIYKTNFDLEEHVHTVRQSEGDPDQYQLSINYNPAYKSRIIASVYLKEYKEKPIQPIYTLICRGEVVQIRQDSSTNILCTIREIGASLKQERSRQVLSDRCNPTSKPHESGELVIIPFYGKE